MTFESIVEIIERSIDGEQQSPEEYHRGRVAAFKFVLELLAEMEQPQPEQGE